MKTVKTKSNAGQFGFSASAEVTEEQYAILANAGWLQVLQRTPATTAEKTLAGYEKRPAGFKRNSIDFTPERAEIFHEIFSKPVEIAEGVMITATEVEVTKHDLTTADVVMKDERVAYARNAKDGTLDVAAKKVGYEGELGDGTAENAPVEFLRAIRAWKIEQTKSL